MEPSARRGEASASAPPVVAVSAVVAHGSGGQRWRLVAVGAAAGVLSGLLGVGGGIIIVPGLVWALGMDRHTATGTSLLAIVPIAVLATAVYAFAPGGAFDLAASAVVVGGSLLGAVLGSRGNARLSERRLRIAFAGFSLLLGIRLVLPFGFEGAGSETLDLDTFAVALLVVLGLIGGFLAGLLGVGGSVIVIAVMVLALGTSQVLAQGVALAAVVPTVLIGAATHRRLGSLDARAALVVGAGGTLGAIPGALLAFALPADVLRTVFGAFLVLMGARGLRAAARAGDRTPRP